MTKEFFIGKTKLMKKIIATDNIISIITHRIELLEEYIILKNDF